MTRISLVAALLLAALTFSGGAEELYCKGDTWAETMLATRTAVSTQRGSSSFEPYESPVIRGGEEARRVSVDVTGVEKLYLVAAIGPDTYNYDQATWGEAVLVATDGEETRLSSLKPVSSKVGWGKLYVDTNHGGGPLHVAGRKFEHGFLAHAPSELVFALGGKYVRFEAWVGIDGADANGTVQFQVLDSLDPLGGVWNCVKRDFPLAAASMERDARDKGHLAWFFRGEDTAMEQRMIRRAVRPLGDGKQPFRDRLDRLRSDKVGPDAPGWLQLYEEAAVRRDEMQRVLAHIQRVDAAALRRAIKDLTSTHRDAYPGGEAFLRRLDQIEPVLTEVQQEIQEGNTKRLDIAQEALALQREALMANPLVDFDRLLLVRRDAASPSLGLPANWQGNCVLPRSGFRNDIAVLSPPAPNGVLETLYEPEGSYCVADLELHYNADRFLFSMQGSHDRWQVWEMGADGSGLRQVTLGEEEDVDNYDACYLPDGRIIYGSTANYQGVPCVFGSTAVANLHLMDADGSGSRQLCFDQDHDWCPAVLASGRVLYQRWEYTDLPHSNTRLLFHMNPDGTGQMEYYGSNSYWPNSVFYARPVPGHPTMVAGIVTGHHGVRRMGELVLFDPARGRQEAEGVVQRIPGYGKKVEAVFKDQLVNDSWPKFLHPYPLNEKYLLAACQPTAKDLWGIYLVDVFDNLLLLREEPGNVLFEPVPIRKTPKPPVVPDKVDTKREDAVVYMADVYAGGGLKDVPRGTVKSLRLSSYVFSYRGMGGLLGVIGMDGPWDIRRVLGTVPVAEDGSALFTVPANTPIAVHPLDEDGMALQQMRSWFTAMPGETLSCVGCHERQNMPPPSQASLASRRVPSEIRPWYGPARSFSFSREVQPVLDRYCVGCHDGEAPEGGPGKPDFRGNVPITDWNSNISGHGDPKIAGQFSVAYANLHRYVRRQGIESDYHLLAPMEFHASTTELVQILRKGHHDVRLDDESWDRLVMWIDLNTPFHGTWTEIMGADKVAGVANRKRELARKYGGPDEDFEVIPPVAVIDGETTRKGAPDTQPGAAVPQAHTQGRETGDRGAGSMPSGNALKGALRTTPRSVELAPGVSVELAYVPAGSFVMGSASGPGDERPPTPVAIAEGFWMAQHEISNAQFACFDPHHDSRVESKRGYQFGVHGFPLNESEQPVVRVTWEQANAFCVWLSEKTGQPFALPSEAQWEYACRAGAGTAFAFGAEDADYSAFANVADESFARIASNPYFVDEEPLTNPNRYDDWVPRDARFDDKATLAAAVGSYEPNAWGLHDMHGNVWEWTRSAYRPYPYAEDDGRNRLEGQEGRVVRGGSWYDRPQRASASYRLAYAPWQPVYNVGFRVICTADGEMVRVAASEKAMMK